MTVHPLLVLDLVDSTRLVGELGDAYAAAASLLTPTHQNLARCALALGDTAGAAAHLAAAEALLLPPPST